MRSFRYPPTWIAGVLATLLVLFIYRSSSIELPMPANLKELLWVLIVTFAGCMSGYIIWMFQSESGNGFLQAVRRGTSSLEDDRDETDNSNLSKGLVAWWQQELPIGNPAEDRFGLNPVAERVASILLKDPMVSVGVIGAFGTGKSSLFYLVERRIKNQSKNTITCLVGEWGVSEGAAASYILRTAIDEMGKHMDCLGVAGLPDAYKKALSIPRNGFIDAVSGLIDGKQNAVDILDKMEEILECTNIRLVVFIEDVERQESPSAKREIEALLDKLKPLKHISFVLAIAEEQKEIATYARILEHIEVLQGVDRIQGIRLIRQFRTYCMGSFAYIDSVDEETKEGRFLTPGFEEYLEIAGDVRSRSVEHLVSLIQTPRNMKTVFRRVWHAWENLYGEVDFDELLVVHALRHCVPEAYAFLIAEFSAMRRLAESQSTQESLEAHMRAKWDEVEREFGLHAQSVRELFDFLIPGGLGGDGGSFRISDVPQGIAHNEPTNYWKRLNAEEVKDEIRDQDILGPLSLYNRNNFFEKVHGLPLPYAIARIEGVGAKVAQFHNLLGPDTTKRLADEVIDIHLSKGEKTVRESGLWGGGDSRRGFRHIMGLFKSTQIPDYENWLVEKIIRALHVSLRYANDLYSCYENSYQDSKTSNRIKIVDCAEKIYTNNVDIFLSALEKDDLYDLHCFAFQYSDAKYGGEGFDPSRWRWLTDLMERALEFERDKIVPRAAVFLISSTHLAFGEGWNHSIRPENTHPEFKCGKENALKWLTTRVNEDGLPEEIISALKWARAGFPE